MTAILHDTTIITTPTSDNNNPIVLPHHSLVYDDGKITETGPAALFQERVQKADFRTIFHGQNHLAIPGLINAHHHLYQSLTRCHNPVQNERLFQWLLGLYQRWRHLDYEAVNTAAKVSLGELVLSGCTTTSDHFYMIPKGSDLRMEAVLDAAAEIGIRIHLGRGSMTLGESAGGLPPDDCVETDDEVRADYDRVLERFHDPNPYAFRRIDLAPCSPFNVSPELFRDTVTIARERNVLLHTHLAETLEEEVYCLQNFGCRPVQYLADMRWLGPDVYLAHCVWLDDDEIRLFGQTKTAVAHCPSANMRLGSGIAPVRKLLAAGARVGLAVDGSSSNDGNNLLGEIKQALLSARLRPVYENPQLANENARTRDDAAKQIPLMKPADAFALATTGSASCLNRDELGHLNPGAAADFALIRNDDLALAGAYAQDPLAAIVLANPPRPEHVFIGGQHVVCEGRLTTIDAPQIARKMNNLVSDRFNP